jgi:hypothetical protein
MANERDIPSEGDISAEPTGDSVERDLFFPEQDDEVIEAKAPITARGVAIVGIRVVAGFVGIGVAVAVVAGASLLPLPTVGSTPPSEIVTPVPTAQQLVCPGAVLRLADDFGQGATTASALGVPNTRYASSSGPIDSTPLSQSDASTGGTAAAPSIISTPPNQTDPTEQILLSGAQADQVSEGDFVGLTSSECAVANGDAWLVGGSTTVGRTTLLTLNNPTEVPATVNLELFGEDGEITAPGTRGIIVPPKGQRVLSLAGFQLDLQSPVVHVMSTGGQVVAQLQQSTVRGLEPGGLDAVGSTVSPAKDNVIPGLVITDVVAVEELQAGGEGFNDLRTELRLFAPGEGTIATTVSVIPEDGTASGASFKIDIEAGRVTDLPIGDLSTGTYTVRVESQSALVAAIRVSSAQGSATDFAWLSATAELDGRAQFTAAPGPNTVLHLANPTGHDAKVTLTARSGSVSTVPVGASSSVGVAVESGMTYEISGFEHLFAAVSLTDGSEIARYPVRPPGAGSTPLKIYR